jgi:uncharacterized protein YjbJ (UPF0337 family)
VELLVRHSPNLSGPTAVSVPTTRVGRQWKSTKERPQVSIIDKITGRTKKAAGDVADDPSLRREGSREERKGEEKEKLSRAQDQVEEKAQDVADLERRT